MITELAAIKFSRQASAGILACTEGWYAPAMPYKIISVTAARRIRLPRSISREKARITAAVVKSSITIMFLLLTLSAIIPPTGDSRMDGIKAQAVTAPYRAEEPVRFRRYKGNANLTVALPKREMIWPMTTRVKSFVNSFSCF